MAPLPTLIPCTISLLHVCLQKCSVNCQRSNIYSHSISVTEPQKVPEAGLQYSCAEYLNKTYAAKAAQIIKKIQFMIYAIKGGGSLLDYRRHCFLCMEYPPVVMIVMCWQMMKLVGVIESHAPYTLDHSQRGVQH